MEAVLEQARPAARVEPVQRWVWQARYGTIVIEVRGRDIFVDGQRVLPVEGSNVEVQR